MNLDYSYSWNGTYKYVAQLVQLQALSYFTRFIIIFIIIIIIWFNS